MEPVSLIFVGVESGDWEGVYVNGELFTESHRLDIDVYCELISNYQSFNPDITRVELTDEQIESMGASLPKHYAEVVNTLSKGV